MFFQYIDWKEHFVPKLYKIPAHWKMLRGTKWNHYISIWHPFCSIDVLKIACLTQDFKSGKPEDVYIYRSASILSCFSTILEQIIYNRLCRISSGWKSFTLYQFNYQMDHATEHTLTSMIYWIDESFEKTNLLSYTFWKLLTT